MTWIETLKLDPDEESRGLTHVFTKRPDLKKKYLNANPKMQKLVRAIAAFRYNLVAGDMKVDKDHLMDSIEAALYERPDSFIPEGKFKFKDWRKFQ